MEQKRRDLIGCERNEKKRDKKRVNLEMEE